MMTSVSKDFPIRDLLDGIIVQVENIRSWIIKDTYASRAERRAYDKVLALLKEIEVIDPASPTQPKGN